MKQKLAESAKLVVALLTILVTGGVGLIPVEYIGWVQLVISLIGAFVLWATPNAAPASAPVAGE